MLTQERNYLRELAKKQREYAHLPVMEERRRMWYDHNELRDVRPPIIIETDTFQGEIMPELRCESPLAREMEYRIQKHLVNHELVDDDKVIPDFYALEWEIGKKQFGIEIKSEHAEDTEGRKIGYRYIHPITDLERDLELVRPSFFWADCKATLRKKAEIEEVLGDILPVVIKNSSLTWDIMPSNKAVMLMGLEALMLAMMDTPDLVHALYRRVTDDITAFISWQQREGLLVHNNGNDYAGAGSYGFTHELPRRKESPVTSKDIWGNMNSQETVGISPEMYGEFAAPYYTELSELFGLVYYGCCEPVDTIYERYVSRYHNLRKVSVSPWCNEEAVGEMLCGGRVIYSRKPSPNYIGTGPVFDEAAYAEHIDRTLRAARGCRLELICRDVYTLCGDMTRPARAVKIMRERIGCAFG